MRTGAAYSVSPGHANSDLPFNTSHWRSFLRNWLSEKPLVHEFMAEIRIGHAVCREHRRGPVLPRWHAADESREIGCGANPNVTVTLALLGLGRRLLRAKRAQAAHSL